MSQPLPFPLCHISLPPSYGPGLDSTSSGGSGGHRQSPLHVFPLTAPAGPALQPSGNGRQARVGPRRPPSSERVCFPGKADRLTSPVVGTSGRLQSGQNAVELPTQGGVVELFQKRSRAEEVGKDTLGSGENRLETKVWTPWCTRTRLEGAGQKAKPGGCRAPCGGPAYPEAPGAIGSRLHARKTQEGFGEGRLGQAGRLASGALGVSWRSSDAAQSA